MSQTLVISEGQVIATYDGPPTQQIVAFHVGCEVVEWSGARVFTDAIDESGIGRHSPATDPRTPQQKAVDAERARITALMVKHAAEADQGVVLSSGIRMKYDDIARANYSQQKAAVDTAGDTKTTWRFWDANGREHPPKTTDELRAILREYAELVAIERERQLSELYAPYQG